MGYRLGVDLGTTFSAAALAHDGRAEMFALASNATAIPSVVYRTEDGRYLTGQTAVDRGRQDPSRVGREFKRRVGDAETLILGGVEVTPEVLMGELLRAIVDEVRKMEGAPPDHVSVCHPANWGPYKQELLIDAIGALGIGLASLVAEPVAAATFYGHAERLLPGDIVAVYDLGGGTFDATVLEHTGDGFEIRGDPDGIDRFGGIDVDEAVRDHVLAELGEKAEHLLGHDERSRRRAGDFRAACVAAKERLSTETQTEVPVDLPGYDIVKIPITRAELERRIRPSIGHTIEILHRTLRAANVVPEQVTKVLLVGGASRMPIVAEMVAADLKRPVAVDAHPKNATALGAAVVPLATLSYQTHDETPRLTGELDPIEPGTGKAVRIDGLSDFVQLAAGEFSTTYRAHDYALDRDVAVKVMHMSGEQSRRRFEREQQTAAGIPPHRRIVATLAHGETAAGQPFVEMEHYERGSLDDWFTRSRRLSLNDALIVGVQIADALAAAHQADVCHRDVRPGNILVAADGSFALSGFGIAALRRDPGASLTTDALTPVHAPPEVLRSGRPGPTADIYSLGSTIYTLIAGRAAFAGFEDEGPYELMQEILDAPIPPIEDVDVPPSLFGALKRAMAKHPGDRFQSADTFGRALRGVQAELGFAPSEMFTAPKATGTDGRARASRKRAAEENAPTSPPPRRPDTVLPRVARARAAKTNSRHRWRRIVVAGVAAVVISGGIGGAVMVTRSDSKPTPTTTVRATATTTTATTATTTPATTPTTAKPVPTTRKPTPTTAKPVPTTAQTAATTPRTNPTRPKPLPTTPSTTPTTCADGSPPTFGQC